MRELRDNLIKIGWTMKENIKAKIFKLITNIGKYYGIIHK